jgi:hypothetical protein
MQAVVGLLVQGAPLTAVLLPAARVARKVDFYGTIVPEHTGRTGGMDGGWCAADGEAYLPSFASSLLPVSPTVFMQIVGGIEIIAGLAVLNGLTRLGANVVMAWLVLIAAAVSMAGYYDIAVRDLVMAMGAYALGQAARLRGEQWIPAAIVMEERVHAQSK